MVLQDGHRQSVRCFYPLMELKDGSQSQRSSDSHARPCQSFESRATHAAEQSGRLFLVPLTES
jgi:hypothetical protein